MNSCTRLVKPLILLNSSCYFIGLLNHTGMMVTYMLLMQEIPLIMAAKKESVFVNLA